MELSLSMTEIWQLAVIKLLFLTFIGLGIFFYWKIRKPIMFVSLISFFSASAYMAIIWQAQVPWWGLVGDEIFVTAFLQKIAGGFFTSDFFYTDLPAFYPPLYFWALGFFGFIFKLNGVLLSQIGVFLVLFITPYLVYFWQRKHLNNALLLVLTPALVYVVSDWQAIILKPYEFISSVLVVLWSIFLFSDLVNKRINRNKIIFYGVAGGLLFLTFYFWFFLTIIAAGIFKLLVKVKNNYYYGNLILVGVIALFVALPFLAPLGLSYIFLGAENWQPAWFLPQDLNLYLPFFELSVFGLVSAIAIASLIYYRKEIYIKAAFALLASTYIWQGISLFTIYFWDVPFLPAKPFIFFGGAVISITAAYGIAKFVKEKVKSKQVKIILFVSAWVLLATQLLGGNFVNQTHVQQRMVAMKQGIRPEFSEVINKLNSIPGISEATILSSGVAELSAFVPLNYYISYNIHFSHPAANFSQRYYFVESLALATSPEDFYNRIKNAPQTQIDALLLLKGEGFYPINFWLDNYPFGGKSYEIRIPASLINDQYFVKLFEDKSFIFFMIK